jgi:hypothetical protein
MNPKQLLKTILSKLNKSEETILSEEKPNWKERCEVGRGTYGEPEIMH